MITKNKQTEKIEIWNGIKEHVTLTNEYNLEAIATLLKVDLDLLNKKFNYDNVAELSKLHVNGRMGKRLIFNIQIDITETCLCSIDYLKLQSYVKTSLKAINTFLIDYNRVTNKNVQITTTTEKPFTISLKVSGHMNLM